MKTTRSRYICLLLIFAFAASIPAFSARFGKASALQEEGIELTLIPQTANAPQGGKVFFRATVKNTGTAAVFLNQLSISLDSEHVTADPSEFYTYFAGSIAPGQQITSKPFLLVETTSNAPRQAYTGTATILGGTDADAIDNVAQRDFTVTVVEPDTSAPNTTITNGPADGNTLCDNRATFTFTATDNTTPTVDMHYRWRLDGGVWRTIRENTVTLTNLTDGVHRFEVSAIDLSGNIDPSPDRRTFSTSLVAPTISGVESSSVAAASAVIRWVTDRPADSTVEQGTTTAYGASVVNPALVTTHRLEVTGLTPRTLYHYRVKSKDGCGRESISADFTFTTTADTTAPNTSFTSGPENDEVICVDRASYIYTGNDDATATNQLEFQYRQDTGEWSPWSRDTSHAFIGLAQGVHTVAVRARDAAGNVDASPATRRVFVDSRQPELTASSVAPRDYRALVSWNTQKPTIGSVEYGLTTAYGSSIPANNKDGFHKVTLTNLTPQTEYHYRIRITDGCNEVIGDDHTFTTTEILKPDLQVTAVSFKTPVRPLERISVTWSVQNNGPGDTPRTFKDRLYLSPTSTLDANAVPLVTVDINNALPEFESYTRTRDVQMPLRVAGNYFLILKTDAEDVISENERSNNTYAAPIEYLRVSNLIAAPDIIPQTLKVGVPITGRLELGNLSSAELTNITATVEDAPANVTVAITPPTRLASLTVREIEYTITAANETTLTSTPKLHFRASGDEEATATFNVTVIPRRPQIEITPGSLSAGMLRPKQQNPNTQAIVEFEIANTGAVAATDVTIALPNLPWMSLATNPTVGTLAPGAKTKVTVQLRPTATMEVRDYTGSLAVNGTNFAGQQVPYTFRLTSDGKGALKIIGQDEFSYFTPERPNLAGVQVVLTNPQTGETVAEGETQIDGTVTFPGLLEGHYNIHGTADRHGEFRSTVQVTAGETRTSYAFLSRQFVTYTWNVIPVDTEDRYRVTIETAFETNVPAPVLTIDPMQRDLRQIQFDTNRQATVYYTITNHGLIAANGVQLQFASDEEYQVRPLVDRLGVLPARTSVVVPVLLTKAGFGIQAVPNCEIKGRLAWYYICGVPIWQYVDFYMIKRGDCPPSSGGRDLDGDIEILIRDGEEGLVWNWPPINTQFRPCNPCEVEFVKWDSECIIGLTPFSCVYGWTIGGCWSKIECGQVENGSALDKINCFRTLAGCFACFHNGVTLVNCFFDFPLCIFGELGIASDGGTRANMRRQYLRMRVNLDAYEALFGDEKWVKGQGIDARKTATFLNEFAVFTEVVSEEGNLISSNEQNTLENLPIASHMSITDIRKWIHRYNRTVDYYSRNITDSTQVPDGQSRDFIAFDLMRPLIQSAQEAEAASVAEGYNDIYQAFDSAVNLMKADIERGASEAGVCARIKLRLTQDVTLTRTAFKGTLEIANGEGGAPITDVRMTLDIRDSEQIASNDRFGISDPVVSGISDVSGTGSLNPGQTGTAVWTMLPAREAAPQVDTQYFIGGEISYVQDGQRVTIPVFPAPITVKPDPLLTLHYFWQRDVYSDDPFTPNVTEPSEPFSLGLLVLNRGYGTARNMRIASSQPEIIENERGLLIDFRLIGAQVNTSPIAPSLDVNLGNIEPQSTATARWLMTSTLQGKFIDYNASFEHLDGLGNPRTSLIERTDIHELEHTVRVMEGDDSRPDFLVNDVPDGEKLPETLWSSDGTTSPVTSRIDATVPDSPVSLSNLTVHLRLPSPSRGYVFMRLNDPADGNFQLLRVLRSDGVEIRLDDNGWGNAWTTLRMIRPVGGTQRREARLYLFDKDSTGEYTLIYGQRTALDATVGAAKKLANGLRVAITGGTTAKFADGSYVEALDRSSAIKVIPNLPNENTQVNVSGILRTDANGERYVEATAVTSSGAQITRPLGMDSRALYSGDFFYNPTDQSGQRGVTGGSGLNTVGLLSRILGKVTARNAEQFAIKDGSGKSVTVKLPSGGVAPELNVFVRVTGIISMEKIGDNTFPILRPRRAIDIVTNPNELNAYAFVSPLGLTQTGQNLLALPGIPLNPDPAVLFTPDDVSGGDLDGRLVRFDALAQADVIYRAANSSEFGGLLNGEGYWLRQNTPGNPFQFDGFRNDFADRYLGLPKTGITQFGHPYLFALNWDEVLVTNGLETISIADAAHSRNPQWLDSIVRYWDARTQTEQTVGLPADNPDSIALQPWRGYRATSFVDNLALIFPLERHTGQPVITDISPRLVAAGDPDFFLEVFGEGFASSSVVFWNGLPRVTFYNSPKKLRAAIPAALIALPGTALVQVGNPALGGTLSKPAVVVIGSANLVLSGIGSIQRAEGQITVSVKLTNTGVAPANNIQVTDATINTTGTQTSPLPLINTIPVGGSALVTFRFPGSAGSPGANAMLRFRATFNGGNFTGSRRIVLP